MQDEIQFSRNRSGSSEPQDKSGRAQMIDFPFGCPCSIPAVLCYNNWQSTEVSQQSSGHQAASKPSRLPPVSAVHVRPLPEFNQDSWVLSAPPGTEKTRENPQPLDLPSNNNNRALPGGRCSAASPAGFVSPLGAPPGGAATLRVTAPSGLNRTSNQAAATDDKTVMSLTSDGGEAAAVHGDDVQEASSSSGDVRP